MIRNEIELNSLLATIRRFVRDMAIPNEDRVEAEDRVPDQIVAEARRLGFFGWSIPKEYGGAGLSSGKLALAFMELSQCSVAYRAHLGTNAEIGSEPVIQEGTDAQKRKYYATEMCGRVADRVVQFFGGQGYVKGRGIERFYRDVRAFRIYEGTSQIHLLNIAKNLLREVKGVA